MDVTEVSQALIGRTLKRPKREQCSSRLAVEWAGRYYLEEDIAVNELLSAGALLQLHAQALLLRQLRR